MSDDGAWTVSHLPASPAAQDEEVRRRFPGWSVRRHSATGVSLVYTARPAGARRTGRGTGPELSLVTDGGPDAGRIAPLPAGGLTVGRGPSRLLLDDRSAPATPHRLRLCASGVEVAGDDDTRFQWDGRAALPLGAGSLRTTRGRQPALRPPGAVPSPVVDVGSPPPEQSFVLPLAMALGPIALGVFLASTTGSAMFLAFGLMSVLGVGVMVGLQRRARRRYAADLAVRAAEVARRRDSGCVTPAEVALAVRSPDEDRFGLGAGAMVSAPVLLWGTGLGMLPLSRPDAEGRWDDAVRTRQAAMTSPTPSTATVVLGGDRAAASVARWTLFQLLRHAVATGAGLVVEEPSRTSTWRVPGADGAWFRLTLPAQEWTAAALREWRSASALSEGATTGPVPTADGPSCVHVVFREGPSRQDGDDVDRVDLGARAVACPADRLTVRDVEVTGIAETTLHGWLAELGDDVLRLGLATGSEAGPPLTLPRTVGTASAADHARVQLTSGSPTGGDPEERGAGVVLDLVDDGPHALIAGTTGSGKSDLLLSVLIGLTAHHSPSELALILLDFKGGASFGRLAGLPHTMSVETNHVGATSLRALDAIAAELRRRERLFAEAGVSDYPAFRRRHPDRMLPRLVVAVDELRVLVDDHADANAVLQRLAATGRSLGFHLLLATQRATGAVSSDVRSNLGSVIALRTATEQESWDLIGSGDAAHIDPSTPGTAYLARGGRPPVTFRAAPWSTGEGAPVWRRAGVPVPAGAEATDWEAVLTHLTGTYAAADLPVPPAVVSPGLPSTFTPSAEEEGDVLALVDDAAHARHAPWRWPRGTAGGTAWIVETGGGRRQVLEAVLATAAGTGPAVLVLDGTGEAASAAGLPDVDVLAPDTSDETAAGRVIEAFTALCRNGGTLVVTGWSSWSGLRVKDTFRSLDEELHRLLGSQAAASVRLAAFGGRELAAARLLLHTPHRFYVPAGTSTDHRLVWPRLTAVEALPGRAVLVGPAHPEPGIPAQLAVTVGEG